MDHGSKITQNMEMGNLNLSPLNGKFIVIICMFMSVINLVQ